MNRKWISLLLLVCVTTLSYPAQSATVFKNKSPYYLNLDDRTPGGYLFFGTPLKLLKQQGDYFQFSGDSIKGWIQSQNLVISDEVFSDLPNSPILCPEIIQEGDDAFLYFYAYESVVKYDIYKRKKISTQKSGILNNIYTCGKGDTLLVEGINTNGEDIHHLRILHLGNGHYVNLMSYDKKTLFLEGKFSPDAKYISLIYKVGNDSHTVVFQSDNGQYKGTAVNGEQCFWVGNKLLLQDNNSFWMVDVDTEASSDFSFQTNRLLFKVKASDLPKDGLESEYKNGILYYSVKNGVRSFDLNQKTDSGTRLKSLEFDSALQLCHDENNDRQVLYSILNGGTLSRFTGSKPQYRFIQFFNDHILYSRIVDKLDTMFLAPVSDPYSDTAYKFKSIDKIDASSPQGILAEISHDKDLSAILVEVPWKQMFYVILIKNDKK